MRPSPDEVIAGVRAILKSDIAPNLPKPAQPQIKRLISVLRDAHWNEAAFELMHENQVFAELARNSAAGLERAAALLPLAQELAAATEFAPPRTFAAANAINHRLRDALAQMIAAIRDEQLTTLDPLCEAIGTALLALRQEQQGVAARQRDGATG